MWNTYSFESGLEFILASIGDYFDPIINVSHLGF